jgi:hypothetical protein
MWVSSTYHSRIYRDFKAIDANAYRDIIRFYEEREEAVLRLDIEEGFEMMVAYTHALFELGDYRKYLLMVDPVVETSVHHNIREFGGHDIFRLLLFRKAAALFHEQAFEKAEYILRELIHIDPYDGDAIVFLTKCRRRSYTRLISYTKAVSVFLILTAALVTGIEVLAVRPFFSMYTPVFETLRYALFAGGVAVLAGGDIAHRLLANYQVRQFVQGVKSNK